VLDSYPRPANVLACELRARILIVREIGYRMGDHLDIEALAKELDASQADKNIAISQLQCDGLLDAYGRITEVTSESASNRYDLRLWAESNAAYQIPASRRAKCAQELRDLNQQMNNLSLSEIHQDIIHWLELDARFHEKILRFGGFDFYTPQLRQLYYQIQLSNESASRDAERRHRVTTKEHLDIIDAIGDKTRSTCKVFVQHWLGYHRPKNENLIDVNRMAESIERVLEVGSAADDKNQRRERIPGIVITCLQEDGKPVVMVNGEKRLLTRAALLTLVQKLVLMELGIRTSSLGSAKRDALELGDFGTYVARCLNALGLGEIGAARQEKLNEIQMENILAKNGVGAWIDFIGNLNKAPENPRLFHRWCWIFNKILVYRSRRHMVSEENYPHWAIVRVLGDPPVDRPRLMELLGKEKKQFPNWANDLEFLIEQAEVIQASQNPSTRPVSN
jgi:DNA-binding GntR family transcriptional regulator